MAGSRRQARPPVGHQTDPLGAQVIITHHARFSVPKISSPTGSFVANGEAQAAGEHGLGHQPIEQDTNDSLHRYALTSRPVARTNHRSVCLIHKWPGDPIHEPETGRDRKRRSI